jgi:hypothetical protein
MDHQRETTRHQDTRAASRLGWLLRSNYNTLKNTKDFETILHNLRQIFTSVSQQIFAQAETPSDGL